MKTSGLITATFILFLGAVTSRAAHLDRISASTGVPVETLQTERASTGLGWGGIEKAHLLSNATGQSFDDIVALHRSGQGWGKIAHNNGLNLGRLVSNANRSSTATTHAQNTQTIHGQNSTVHGKSSGVHGKSATNANRGHSSRTTRSRSMSHGSGFRTAHSGFHGMHGMGGMGHGGGGMGHGGRGH